MRVLRVDHIAVAVRDLERSLGLWEVLMGTEASPVETLPERGVRVARIAPAGGGAVELVSPLGQGSPLDGFLEKKGEGLHHICLEVDDIEAAMAELKARGFELLQDRPVPGAEASRIAFLHPKSSGGVLLELRQKRAAQA